MVRPRSFCVQYCSHCTEPTYLYTRSRLELTEPSPFGSVMMMYWRRLDPTAFRAHPLHEHSDFDLLVDLLNQMPTTPSLIFFAISSTLSVQVQGFVLFVVVYSLQEMRIYARNIYLRRLLCDRTISTRARSS